MKEKLLISFSGGRTSAYMTWWIMNEWKERDNYEIKIVFANTGKEQEGTLRFVQDCSDNFGLEIIWVEGYPKEGFKGWAVQHKIVDFKTASRKGEPFEAMIQKLGIPSQEAPFCSDQMKRLPIESYLKSVGWDDFYKALGIRADEIDRMNENFRKKKIIYPLIRHNPVNRKMVNRWWKSQSFDLKIDEQLGNCDCCWKKAMSKLADIAERKPELFGWWQEMTDKYSDLKPRKGAKEATMMNFYRGNKSPQDIIELGRLSKRQLKFFIEEEKLDGCNESCEPFK